VRRLLFIAAALHVTTSCGAPRVVLPTGPGAPAPEAATAWAQATKSCRDVRSFAGELRLSGHAGERKLRGTIQSAVTANGQIGLEMPAPFGQPVFILAGSADRTTLLLPRDGRYLVAPAADILDALIGTKLDPRLLLALLAGCGGRETAMTNAVRYGGQIAVATSEGRVFLAERKSAWEVVAAEITGLIVEYPEAAGGSAPPRLRLSSMPGQTPAIDLSVSTNQVELNGTLPPTAFAVQVPANATPLTLADLRAGAPLGEKPR
jgi:hypothetical protein